MSCELSDNDFIFNYRNNKLKSSGSKDPYTKAISSRRCMILSLSHSSRSLNNATSCHIFDDQLQEYFGLIDDRNGINNFAKATLDLMSNVKNVSKSWISGVPDSPNIINILKPLEGECLNSTNDSLCSNALPPSALVKTLLGPSELPSNKKSLPTTTVQSTLDGFRRNSAGINQTRGPERIPCVSSSYKDFQKIENRNVPSYDDIMPRNNFGDTRKGKNPLYSSCNEYTNYKPKKEETFNNFQNKQGGKSDWRIKKKNLYSNYSDVSHNEPSEKSGKNYQCPGGREYARHSKPTFTSGGFQNNTGNDNDEESHKMDFENHFKTAKHELQMSNQKKFGNSRGGRSDSDRGYGGYERNSGFQPQVAIKKSLGGKRSVSSKFVPPVKNNSQEDEFRPRENIDPESELDERLKNIEPRMVELIKNEIMDSGSNIDWDDIAGLEFAKNTIQEIVVWPMLRPDIFTGLRRPPKGILLFGPPGTGKTLIGKCIASQSNSTFFSISASSLTSKWIGDGEKMVRALFAVARCHQPAVVFIDEIDSLLSQRSDTEHESSRRIKTEFLVQLDGAATGEEDRILVIGATNRPQELDEAARRRLVKRLYIPLPDKEARKQLTQNLVKLERNDLTADGIEEIACLTDGYSGADMKNLCQEASLGPIRSISSKDMFKISAEQVRPVNISDFKMAIRRVKSSVSSQDLEIYLKWDQQYGSGAFV